MLPARLIPPEQPTPPPVRIQMEPLQAARQPHSPR